VFAQADAIAQARLTVRSHGENEVGFILIDPVLNLSSSRSSAVNLTRDARALKDRTLIRSTESKIAKSDLKVLEQLMEEAKRNATRSISIRVPVADLEQARRIAEKIGVGY